MEALGFPMTDTDASAGTTFTNGRISFTKDLVFGLCVLTEEEGWLPLTQLNADALRVVDKALDFAPGFPFPNEYQRILAEKGVR